MNPSDQIIRRIPYKFRPELEKYKSIINLALCIYPLETVISTFKETAWEIEIVNGKVHEYLVEVINRLEDRKQNLTK
jgi:hypothetical protein